MKNYLNNEEQQLAFLFAGISEAAKDRLKNKHITGEQRKALKYIATYGHKGLKSMIEPIDQTEAKTLYSRSQRVQFGVFAKDEYAKMIEKEAKLNKVNVLSNDQMLGLANAAVASCSLCEFEGQEISDCSTRKTLIECQVAPIKNHGECPYRVR